MSTATKRTPALLLRQPKCHQAGQSLTSSGQEGVPRRCPVQHFYLSSHTRFLYLVDICGNVVIPREQLQPVHVYGNETHTRPAFAPCPS
ncbi:hypothetical protein MHYP_G00235830 [Metynnis hypsauchen]